MAFHIVRNDITKMETDAIVNTANPESRYGRGTNQAIYQAAGKLRLLHARKKIGDIAVGDAAITPGFDLPAKYIIHTVGPVWVDGQHGEEEHLVSCYENCLILAKENGCESISFPLISTGSFGFPKEGSLKIALSVFMEFLKDSDMEITLVVFDEESFKLSGVIFPDMESYIDENYVIKQTKIGYEDDSYKTQIIFADRETDEDKTACLTELSPSSFKELENNQIWGRPLKSKSEKKRKKETTSKTSPDAIKDTAPKPGASRAMLEAEANVVEAMAISMAPVPEFQSMRSLDNVSDFVGESFQESLFRLIDERGYTDTEVYKRANLNRKLFSKIRSNTTYQPKKNTAVALALALKLNMDETKDLLARAGYAFSPSSLFDIIIQYFIAHEVYDIYAINVALFEHDQPILGE